MRTCVIIPTYNEAVAIGDLIKRIRAQGLDILVVDDGSLDNTAKIAEESGAAVLINQTNQGKGASLIRGFEYAVSKDYDAVITMDGDGQHLPEDIPFFLRLAKYSKNSIFIGNRMQKTKDMPFVRLLTNQFMSWLISLVAGQKIPDTQSGFRLIKKDLLGKIDLNTKKFEIESEMLIKASRLGFEIESVPIKTIYQGQKSQINPFVDTMRFIKFILKESWSTRH